MIEVKKLASTIEEEDLKQSIHIPRNFIFYYMIAGMLVRLYIAPQPILMKFLWTMGILLVAAEIYVSWMKRKIEVIVKPLPKVLHKGEHIQLELTVKNLSRLPLPYTYFCLKESYSLVPKGVRGLCITLSPKSSKVFRIPYEVMHSGSDEIGIEKMVWMDYLEIARRSKKDDRLQEIILLPRIQPLKGNEILSDETTYKRGEALEGKQLSSLEGEVGYELAPYEGGTSERLIHWKLVAQRDLYQVRERKQLMRRSKAYSVIMDPLLGVEAVEARKKADLTDQIITLYLSYLYGLIQQGEKVTWVGYYKGKWIEKVIDKESDFYEIQEILCNKYFVSTLKENTRWPQFTGNKAIEKILLTTHLEEDLKKQVEQDGFKVIWLQEESIREEAYEKIEKHKKFLRRGLQKDKGQSIEN